MNIYIKGTKYYLQTNSSQYCNIETKTQKKYLNIVITIYSIKK